MLKDINGFIRNNDYRSALELLEKTPSHEAKFYVYEEKKADVYYQLKRFADAVRAIENAIAIRPDIGFLREKLAYMRKASQAQTAGLSETLTHTTTSSGSAIIRPTASITPFCGMYERSPGLSAKRKMEGGLRLQGKRRTSTTENPLVSIVTVVFNNPDPVERCIKSVLAQDYPNVEYVVIDGGSDKPTLDIISKYAENIDYFVSEPDRGIYDAMNKGIELSLGDYICLLNSDDYYDPTFVSKSVALATEKSSAIVYSQFINGTTTIKSRGASAGVSFGHLNMAHSTFLVHRDCYNLVGRYLINYRIVSDALWMIEAYKKGVRFDSIAEPLLTFAGGGVSSGSTPENRELLISEVVESYIYQFAFLGKEDAKEIYLLRFDNKRLDKINGIADKHAKEPGFKLALASYVEYCFRDRDNFKLSHVDSGTLFPLYIRTCNALNIQKNAIRIATKHGCFSQLVASIDSKIACRKANPAKTILHFASVFSAPSETFIYDLLTSLEDSTAFDNYMLFEQRQLAEQRPFEKSLWIPWADFRPEIRNALYQHIFATLKPDVIVGHFALNTWKLEQRLKPLNIEVPVLSMTHGIDVFMLKQDGAYRDYILQDYIPRQNTHFSAVSNFLMQRLITLGVPSNKVSLVPNTVNARFLAHRKTKYSRQPGQAVRLLAVGRLIDWKGHRHLIQALATVKAQISVPVSLSIVFGNGRDLFDETVALIKTLGLESDVELIPYVDFAKNPDYYSQYDLFVHPSTYSEDNLHRTETFGVSVLEAIAAGLPIIATDAGGVPEVIGPNNQFARVVPHGNPDAMAAAIIETIGDPSSFGDNSDYAAQRLALFTEKHQIVELAKLIYHVCGAKFRAALFSSSTIQGAGYAAYRLHRGLLKSAAISPTIFTSVRNHHSQPGVKVITHPSGDGVRWRTLQKSSISKPNLTIFTVNHPILENSRLGQWVENADIINLHWTARFLSIENIAYLTQLNKPVVLTVRDMHSLTGGCHFFHGCQEWTRDCMNCPQLVDTWDNLPSRVVAAKRRFYDFKNLTLVALSQHSADIIRRTPFFQSCRLEVIPNSIETEIFKPIDKRHAREKLGLPLHRKIIGYVPSFSSTVKGYNEILHAFERLAVEHADLNPLVLLVGNQTPATEAIKLDKHNLGYISDNAKLALAYSAADVIAVPSLEETFSNTTAEAISCGTPVVGFKTGAIPEMVQDGITGFTFAVGDSDGLMRGIAQVLSGPDLSQNCRRYAEEKLSFQLQAKRYEDLFTELVVFNKKSDRVPPVIVDYFPETTPTVLHLLEALSYEKR